MNLEKNLTFKKNSLLILILVNLILILNLILIFIFILILIIRIKLCSLELELRFFLIQNLNSLIIRFSDIFKGVKPRGINSMLHREFS